MLRKLSLKATLVCAVLAVVLLPDAARGTFVDVVNSYNPVAYWRLAEQTGPEALDGAGSIDGAYLGGTQAQPGAITREPDTTTSFDAEGCVAIPHSDGLALDSGTGYLLSEDIGTWTASGLFSRDSRDSGAGLVSRAATFNYPLRRPPSAMPYEPGDPSLPEPGAGLMTLIGLGFLMNLWHRRKQSHTRAVYSAAVACVADQSPKRQRGG